LEAESIRLPTGILEYQGNPLNTRPLTALCTFGARHNPKRGFVFISKVLGKHWPAAPSAMKTLHRELAGRIPRHHKGPVLFVAMAETATGLGHGVFEAFVAEAGLGSALFLQTTRYPLSGATPIVFQEEHSHATKQFLYRPEDPSHQALVARATSAVLVDDEATSGKTFLNLVVALRAAYPALEAVYPLMLTDFTRRELDSRLRTIPGVAEARSISLWEGSYRFSRDPTFNPEPAKPAFASVACRRPHITPFTGRLGLTAPIEIPDLLVEECQAYLDRRDVLVVGTGECMHPAFRLALSLEAREHSVHVQSTTRSPLMHGESIHDVRDVVDPYGEGIPNFLYNTSLSSGARIVVVHETRERERVRELVAQLDAIEVSLSDLRVSPPPSNARR
jgi:hypothetical protein